MNRDKNPHDHIKRQLQKHFGHDIPEFIWNELVVGRWISTFAGETSFKDLARQAALLLRVYSADRQVIGETVPDERQRRTKHVTGYEHASSRFLAHQARKEAVVQEFRKKYLSAGLLLPDQVSEWLIANTETGRTAIHAVIIRMPIEAKLVEYLAAEQTIPITRETLEGLATVDYVCYQVPDFGWVRRVPAGRNGTVRDLFNAARSLASLFSWTEDQATMFILTDAVPLVPSIRFTVQPKSPLKSLTRITLTVSPSTTPRELAQQYSKFRSKLIGSGTKGADKRIRRVSEKHASLAVFALECNALDRGALSTWNGRFPKWSYERLNRFSKEAKVAMQRMETLLHRSAASVPKLVESLNHQKPPARSH